VDAGLENKKGKYSPNKGGVRGMKTVRAGGALYPSESEKNLANARVSGGCVVGIGGGFSSGW